MPPKRKRTGPPDGESRPSPHRPANTNLAQHERGPVSQVRRSSQGGQGGQGRGRGGRRPDTRDNPSNLTVSSRAMPTSGPMSPPARPISEVQTLAPVPDVPTSLVRPSPTPFDYVFLTDERISSWAEGRQAVVASGIQSREDEDTTDLAAIFQELVRATLDLRIDATDAGSCVKEILGPDTTPVDHSIATFDPQTFFIDTLSMICDSEDEVDPILRNFVVATDIPSIYLRQKLDSGLLPTLGLTRVTFVRVGIRQATHLLYRQANYNLLREETEGYSKLLTELFTTSGSEPPSGEVVEEAFEKMKGLIGTFDLDVGRVLDITLDVFAAVLVKHYRFFIKLLRVSSWWPRESEIVAANRLGGLPKWALPSSPGWTSTDEDEEMSKHQRISRDTAFWQRAQEVGLDAFFELGGRQAVDAESKKRLLNGRDDDAELDVDRQWIEGTGTFPPSGNRVAAQLLGFKLRFYASPARDNHDVLPPNLIYLTALLIKIGFISLRDLYPHLWPLDENMEEVRQKRMKELLEKEKLNRPGGGANALMTAGALPDESLPNGGRIREAAVKVEAAKPAEKEDKDALDEPSDTKVLLLINLLTIGALPEALFILGRFPWLPEAYPELFELIHRILNHSLTDVYKMVGPSFCPPPEPDCSNKSVPDYDQNGVPKGQVRLAQLPTRKQLRWPFPDKYDTNENLSYRFYWDEWADNIPVCQSVDDVFTLCSTLLNYSGVNIGRDGTLHTKLARIGAKSLSADRSQHNLDRWQDLLKRLLVPALSFTKSNTSAVNEVYDMLRFYPVAVRYSIYAEWFEGQTSRLPAMKTVFARTKLETLGIMKRISMTNITLMARSLAKTAYASPGIVFSVALNQIESYNNLTEVVVECAKYFTDLGYDVLVWSLMSSLGGKDRNRSNAEFPLLPSRWLLALSRFSGKVFKRYSIMNISPIIQYVNNQLYLGIPNDLVILKELIAQMAGIVPDTDFTDAQLTALTGGEVLRQQTLINLQDKRYESTKTAKRLMKGLVDTDLAGQLLLSIAQHRQSAIYGISDDEAAIKFLSTMVDDTQLILFQYLDLLRSNLSVEDFDKHVPSIPELIAEFGLDPSLAFMIGRASLTDRISRISLPVSNGTSKSPPALQSSSELKPNSQGDMNTDGADLVLLNGESKTAMHLKTEDGAQTVQVGQIDDVANTATPQAIEVDMDPFREILQPIISSVEQTQTEGSWDAISAEFYVTFWASQLSDLSVPSDSYQVEVRRIMEKDSALSKDRSDMSRPGMIRKEEAKKALEKTRVDLMAELNSRVTAYKTRKFLLLKRKSAWFDPNTKADIVSDAILEKCILPRVLLSPSDADYCFRMVKMLHDNGTPNFRTLSLYGRLLRPNRLRALIFSCTLREAENLGRFLKLILKDLSRWHVDRKVYEKEAWGASKALPGFAKAINPDGTPKSLLDHDGGTGFKNILFQWHKSLNIAIRDCLEGMEWMHIRNAATVLKTVLEVFPAVDFMGNGFVKQLETVAKREKDVREDLSLPANAVLVQLKKRSKTWVMVQAFSNNISPAAQANGTAGRVAQTNGTPVKSNLKPTAAEFKPGSAASSLSVSTPKASVNAEVEDGEVDDVKTSTSVANTSADKPAGSEAASVSETSVTATPKSEILLKREQIIRDRDAKAAAISANLPSRSEQPRNVATSLPSERSGNLPSRPDAPIPPHRMLHQTTRVSDRRDGWDPRDSRDRESRLPDPNRLDRPSERSREFTGNDRRDVGPRDYTRPLDRETLMPRDRARLDPPPRWISDPARENAERVATNTRNDNSGRLSRDHNMPPPRSFAAPVDRGPPATSDRAPLVNFERQELINPERAALINESKETSSRSNSPRRNRDEVRDKPPSRPPSPRRHGSEREIPEARRDDRPNRNGPDSHTSSRHIEESQPPAGPRSERSTDRASEWTSSERQRDYSAFQSSQTSSRQIDPDHGRLNSTSRPQPDPNFGRLNPAPTPEVPLGPRGTSRGNRITNLQPPSYTAPHRDSRLPMDAPRATTPEKQVPTGPSSTRQPRRSASGQFDQHPNATGSAPVTPVVSSPANAIHPDRLKHLGAQAVQPLPPTVHPDRLRAFGETAVPSATPSHSDSFSRPQFPPIMTGGPPSGPKGSQSSPNSSGPNGISAPTGPASAVERAPRGRRQLAGINTMLQQGAQQNVPDRMNIRGRNNRMNPGVQFETPNSAPSTPILPPPTIAAQLGREEPSRDIINPERADLITGGVTLSGDERDRDRYSGRRERSGHHSRIGSRSPPASSERARDLKRSAPDDDRSRDAKRVDRGPPEDDRTARGEHRDRRGVERESERERHPGREAREPNRDPTRDLMAGRDMGRDRVREGDRERDSSRREGRDRDAGGHDAGYVGANERGGERGSGGRRAEMRGDPRGEERRDTRGSRDDVSRKRRSDGDGNERGHDKRPRR